MNFVGGAGLGIAKFVSGCCRIGVRLCGCSVRAYDRSSGPYGKITYGGKTTDHHGGRKKTGAKDSKPNDLDDAAGNWTFFCDLHDFSIVRSKSVENL